jgi:hypothetical protein
VLINGTYEGYFMNQTSWENVRKSHKQHVKVITISVIAVAAVAAIIILNNHDLISGNAENANSVDSASFSFIESEVPTQIEGFESDTPGYENQSSENHQDTAPKVQKNQSKKDTPVYSHSDDKPIESRELNSLPTEKKIEKVKPVATTLASGDLQPDERIPRQNESLNPVSDYTSGKKSAAQSKNPLKEQVFLLTNVQSRVIDRKDLIISLALELFYTDSITGSDLRINRDALRVVALKVLQDKPLASLKKELLAEEFKNEMNGMFERKALIKVRIREFHIEKVSEQ